MFYPFQVCNNQRKNPGMPAVCGHGGRGDAVHPGEAGGRAGATAAQGQHALVQAAGEGEGAEGMRRYRPLIKQ